MKGKLPQTEYYEKMTIFYKCNPKLFEKCKKTACQQECKSTTHKAYAEIDDSGNPIVDSIVIQTTTTYKMED